MDNVCYATSSPRKALYWTTLAFFAGFAGVSTFGPIVAKLKESMVLSPILMGLLGASPALSGSLLRIPFGAMVDRVGGKKPILFLLGLSSLGIGAITIFFFFFPSPQLEHFPLLLCFGILCGCGIAVFSVGIPTVSYWFPQRKQGAVLALYGGLGNLAPGIFAFVLPLMVLHASFTYAYTFWFFMLFVVMALFFLFMKDAPYFQYKEMGMETDENSLLIACGEELVPVGNALTSMRKAGSDYRTWILTFLYFVSFGGFIALTVWFPTYWKEYFGMTLVQSGLLTSLYSLSTSILRVAGGLTSDKLGGEKVAIGSFFLTFIGAGLIMVCFEVRDLAITGMMVLALGMGFANAAVFKLVPKYMPAVVGGTAGIVGGLGALGGFVIPIIMGSFVKQLGARGYNGGFSVVSVLSAVSLGLILLLLKGARRERSLEDHIRHNNGSQEPENVKQHR